MCNWRGFRTVGKAACRKFFFPPSVLTCSPAGQHILSTSVGLAGQTEPFCPPSFWSELQKQEPHLWLYWGWWGRQADIFSWITLSSGFLLCVFQVFSLQMTFFKGEETVLNISTCGTAVTWLFPFQTLDLCLPAKTHDAGSRGGWRQGAGRERCGQSGNAEDGGEDYAKCRPLLNVSLLSINHACSQTSVQILSQPSSRWDEAWRELFITALRICFVKMRPKSRFQSKNVEKVSVKRIHHYM